MIVRFLVSLLLFVFICVPAIVISAPVVALLLLTGWQGRTTIFGNAKWGKGDTNPSYMKSGYFAAWNWLVVRNPVNNLCEKYLAAAMSKYMLTGTKLIGDKVAGGFYTIRMGLEWEYYWIKPYTVFGSKRCVRVRVGWKICDNTSPLAAFVFVVNPWKSYLGA